MCTKYVSCQHSWGWLKYAKCTATSVTQGCHILNFIHNLLFWLLSPSSTAQQQRAIVVAATAVTTIIKAAVGVGSFFLFLFGFATIVVVMVSPFPPLPSFLLHHHLNYHSVASQVWWFICSFQQSSFSHFLNVADKFASICVNKCA